MLDDTLLIFLFAFRNQPIISYDYYAERPKVEFPGTVARERVNELEVLIEATKIARPTQHFRIDDQEKSPELLESITCEYLSCINQYVVHYVRNESRFALQSREFYRCIAQFTCAQVNQMGLISAIYRIGKYLHIIIALVHNFIFPSSSSCRSVRAICRLARL